MTDTTGDKPLTATITYKKNLLRLVKVGTIGDCPNCGSTTLKKHEWGIFGRWGKNIGCIQPECENYHDSIQNKRDKKLDQLGI